MIDLVWVRHNVNKQQKEYSLFGLETMLTYKNNAYSWFGLEAMSTKQKRNMFSLGSEQC